MGTILKAECSCGYENEKIYFGAGMDDQEICDVPALKNGTFVIEMKNIRRRDLYPNYIFYTENVMFESIGSGKTHDAWQFQLQQENNLCPECKLYEMKFLYLGEYD